jgi:membrane protein
MAEKKSLIQKLQALLDERGLRSEAELTRLHKFIHFWVLLGNSFVRNRCPIRASALSYTTLLALIPLLAVAISVTSSLLKDQGEDRIYDFVDQFVAYMIPPTGDKTNSTTTSTNAVEAAVLVATNADLTAGQTNFPAGTNEVILSAANNSAPASGHDDRVTTAQREAAQKIHEFISNIRSGTLGTIGMILLLVVGIRMLGSVESTFNDIWGVTRGRNWLSRVQIYCTTILLGPLLLAGAAALAGGSHLQTTRALITKMPFIGSLIFPTLTLVTLWLTFALFYQLVPNTKVKFSAALIGGIVGGSLWHLNNLFGFIYASRVVTNTNIYGSLALVPVFMAGLYLSWFILLLGAQVAYAFQNRTLYLQEKIAENVNQRGREFIALRLMTCIGQRFQRGLPPATIQEMSGELAIPSRLVQQVLQTLIAAHLVAEIHGVEPAYTPARPLEAINAHHILQAMRATHGQELVTRDEPIREEVYGEFARIQEAEKQAASTVTMLALVGRAQARLEFPAPQTARDEIKMKPALVPSIEPVAGSATQPALTIPPAAETESDFSETAAATEIKLQPKQKPSTQSTVQPSTEEERDFPL